MSVTSTLSDISTTTSYKGVGKKIDQFVQGRKTKFDDVVESLAATLDDKTCGGDNGIIGDGKGMLPSAGAIAHLTDRFVVVR